MSAVVRIPLPAALEIYRMLVTYANANERELPDNEDAALVEFEKRLDEAELRSEDPPQVRVARRAPAPCSEFSPAATSVGDRLCARCGRARSLHLSRPM